MNSQKIIYIEASHVTSNYLNCLMIPTIVISASASVLSGAGDRLGYNQLIISCITAFGAFLLAIINYLKNASKNNIRIKISGLDSLPLMSFEYKNNLENLKWLNEQPCVWAACEFELMKKLSQFLSDGIPLRLANLTDDEITRIKTFNLLTSKPVLYACNVSEDDASIGNNFT